LLVEAGKALNPNTWHFEQLGLPYGSKSRLLLMHLNSEAVRRQSPIIPVEDTMTAFFRRLMGRTQDGRQAKMLKGQLSALAAAQFRMGISGPESALQINTQIVGAFNLGVTSRFAQNRTLSGKGHEIRPFHKRRYSDELSPLRQI